MAQSDRVAIITGGARGIGAACARRFVEEGVRVVIADVEEDAGEALAKDLDAGKGRALFVDCDVSDKLAVANLMAETRSAFDRVDVLINNAAIVADGDILDLEVADFDRVMGVNLRGAFLVARAVARQIVGQIEDESMRSDECRKRYAIVNMSSINAQVSIPNQLAYSMSKGALNQMTKSMALALASQGVRVNAIGPGSINTDLLKAVSDDKVALERIMSRTPLGRLGDPDEIASIAWFLASKDASYITGECIYADGGRLALNYTMSKRDD
ncbi:SDR family NAD(P)-dependent oxidoreductase [Marinicauda sp. Alg238-R41]|jgi:NAD(P)-dependent dehydrogenase (short-subunit alcohol dehydrogenase family)|uniref:SDR family NAD(P)-dependent oxidoreductase n=1 Tax=Marinicauda sp. Alg238-R41 TaxID=2993447 RepID=UPI0022E17F3C|nr:glucose 1-dehydrogenase [Marinicauda sp. Alg238-R41]